MHAPLRQYSGKQRRLRQKPWITKAILKSIKYKQKFYFLTLLMGMTCQSNTIKKFSNLLTRIEERSKSLHYHDPLNDVKHDSCGTWRVIKELLASSPTKRLITPYLFLRQTDGENLSNAKNIANTSNNSFSTIGEKLAENIKKHDILSYTHFLKNRISSSFFLNPPSIAEVYAELCLLSLTKSTGPDDIPSYFVKLAAPIISPYLTYFIETSLKLEIFPNSQKVAKVLPIFNKGFKATPENIRPIFILPALSKIFEKVLSTKLLSFFTQNSVLQCTQYAFVKSIIQLKLFSMLLHTYTTTTTYIQTIILVS